MTVEPGWVPPGIDISKANIARVYDWWLGGDHNFLADQDAARAMIAVEPNTRGVMRANRGFLGRAVRYLAGQAGIRQFLDIGSGIPTQNNVHQVAQETAPGSRVMYVDNDDVAVAHSRLLLDDNPDAAVIQADLREADKILAAPETQLMLDFTQPVALLLLAVLHFIPDTARVTEVLAILHDALAPGSYLVISHGCQDARPEIASAAQNAYNNRVNADARLRSREQIAELFDGFTLIEPGLVWTPQWRPDSPADVPDDPERYWCLAGVGRRNDTP
jgi:SAM-dependent methyltransferase